MIKIAVCDDEQLYLSKTCAMLKEYISAHGIEVSAETFLNSSALVDSIEAGHRYDIYLLDIYMPGLSGMSVATDLRARSIRSPIIFLTTSTEHALEAFGVDATHYLLKPYTEQQFCAAMDKAMQSITTHLHESIVIKTDDGVRSIPDTEIVCCEARDKYQRISLLNGEKLLVRMTTAELFRMLESAGCFYRCGRGHIINLEHLKKVANGVAFLKNGEELPVPRSAAAGLRAAFFEHFN